jgi:hypothetical protein
MVGGNLAADLGDGLAYREAFKKSYQSSVFSGQ